MTARPLPQAARDSEILYGEKGLELRGVAILASGFDFRGGMEGQARLLARGLVGRGVPITFITTVPPDLDLPRRETLGLINVFRVPVLRSFDWSTTLDVLELFALAIVRARLTRLNLIYGVHHEVGAIASRVGRATGLPVVVKLSGSGASGDCQTVPRRQDRMRITHDLRHATRLVAITGDIAREAVQLLGVEPERVVRLPNGVDLTRFRPRPWKEELPPRILYVGRLVPLKRIDVLLDAFARIPPREGLELTLAGDGPELESLKTQARSLRIADRVQFLGHVEDVVPLLRSAQVFVLPSVAEGSPNSLLEAIATGVPSISTRVPGAEELVGHEREALLVPPDDAEALAAAITRLLDDPALRKRLAEAGRTRAEAFDLDRVAARHVQLFEQIAAPRDEQIGEADSFNLLENAPLLKAAVKAGTRTVRDGVRSTAEVLFRRLRG